MAFFLGLGLGLWFKKGLPELTYCRKQHRLRCPPLRTALPGNLFFCLIFASFQAVAYHMPFITHSWLFNEVLGFAPGIGIGWLWDGDWPCCSIFPRGDSRSIKIFRRDFVYG